MRADIAVSAARLRVHESLRDASDGSEECDHSRRVSCRRSTVANILTASEFTLVLEPDSFYFRELAKLDRDRVPRLRRSSSQYHPIYRRPRYTPTDWSPSATSSSWTWSSSTSSFLWSSALRRRLAPLSDWRRYASKALNTLNRLAVVIYMTRAINQSINQSPSLWSWQRWWLCAELFHRGVSVPNFSSHGAFGQVESEWWVLIVLRDSRCPSATFASSWRNFRNKSIYRLVARMPTTPVTLSGRSIYRLVVHILGTGCAALQNSILNTIRLNNRYIDLPERVCRESTWAPLGDILICFKFFVDS